MDERGRISATLNCQITATRRSLRTYLNPTWHEPETRERVAPEDIAGNEFPPRVILRCIPEFLPCLTFTLCAECVSVRGSKWAEVTARVRSIYRPSFRASRDLLRTVNPQRHIFRDIYRYVKLHRDLKEHTVAHFFTISLEYLFLSHRRQLFKILSKYYKSIIQKIQMRADLRGGK